MALFELSLIALFVIILLIVVAIAFFFWGIKHAIALGINSVIGFFALYAIKAFVWESLIINFWSVILVAIFGIFGFAAVLILHWVGIWF